MITMFSAMGLYDSTSPLPTDRLRTALESHGFGCSWAVPFGARAYIEKMTCGDSQTEKVRVLVNDRVIPLNSCGRDELGQCTLDRFVASLSFAADGGRWDDCFVQS